jgi:hypothetical protein
MKKPKAETRASVSKDCDKLWSQCVRVRDKTCRRCNSEDGLSAHHIIERTHRSVRFDLDNGIALCWRCHSLQKFAGQTFTGHVIEVIGWPEFQRLMEKSKHICKRNIADLRLERDRLQKLLKEYQADYGFESLPF